MCGRYSEHVKRMRGWAQVLAEWARQEGEIQRRNIAPTQMARVVRADGVISVRWSLVPAWSKEATSKYATFNARLEDIASKPAFRSAWKAPRRCLLPTGGYYEWKEIAGKKQPYFISREDEGPVVLGGIWEEWADKSTGESVLSCAVLTKPAGDRVGALHHRMPVILRPEDAQDWLSADFQQGATIADLATDEGLRYYPVSRRVNSGREEAPELTEPVEIEGL